MRKTRLLLFIVLLVGALGVGYITFSEQVVPEKELQVEEVEKVEERVVLILDFGDGDVSETERDFVEGGTAYSLLEEVLVEKELTLEIEQYDFGVFVKAIDGRESGSEMAWIYFVNGESGSVASDTYELQAGDRIEWKYIEPEF